MKLKFLNNFKNDLSHLKSLKYFLFLEIEILWLL